MFVYTCILLIIIIIFITFKTIKIKENFENDNLTVVSGYWEVKNKYNDESYKKWFNNTLKINQKYIFFCDKNDIEFIKTYRNKEIKFIHYPLNNFYSKKIVKDEWVDPIHSPSKELSMIWHEKIHLMKLAKDQDKYPTEYYAWIDAGISPYRDKIPPNTRLNINNQIPKNKICYSWADDNIAAGVLIMHKDMIDEFHDKYYDAAKKCNQGHCGKEQHVLTQMMDIYPDLFYKIGEGYGQILVDLYK